MPHARSFQDIAFSWGVWLERELAYRQERNLDTRLLDSYYRCWRDEKGRANPLSLVAYTQRLIPMIRVLAGSPSFLRVLDAGCGYGTESLLFSLLGAEVTGLELVGERLELARSRIPYFQSLVSFPLKVTFIHANIFRFLQTGGLFDVIWAMESISHIYPPEVFLGLARDRLREGGRLIISDPNRANPLVWLREIQIRGSLRPATHQKFQDPETGLRVEVAQENRFSVPALRKKLSEAGFQTEEVYLSGFMGSSVWPRPFLRLKPLAGFLRTFQDMMRTVPVLKYLGSLYTVVAVKK